MFFYDWEPNVLGPGCKPAPTDQNTTGGSAAGQPGAATLSYYAAVVRAAKCPAKPRQSTSTNTPTYYLVDDKAQQVLAGPEATQRDLFTEPQMLKLHQTAPRAGQTYKVVQPGTSVIEAEYDKKAPADTVIGRNTAQYYVLNDNFALRGTDITDPQQTFDNGPGGTGAPIVTFNFTDSGRKIWQTVTKRIAERGQSNLLPGQNAQAAFPALRGGARQQADQRPVHRLPAEPRGHRRQQRLADRGRLHDHVRPEPGQPAQERRAADPAGADQLHRRSRPRSASRPSSRASRPASSASSSSACSCCSSTACWA